jgi:hypothetical protein
MTPSTGAGQEAPEGILKRQLDWLISATLYLTRQIYPRKSHMCACPRHR